MRGLGLGLGGWVDRVLRIVGVSPFALIHEDRRVLERGIFPAMLAREDLRRVLFVGCDWYTRHYSAVFRSKEYWTLERDPGKSLYGAERHLIGRMEHLGDFFAPGTLDLIICNGVYGWGLDARDDIEAAFDASFDALREGGLFLLGWNDVPEHRPFPLAELASLRRFTRFSFAPFGTADYVTNTSHRHVYSFYVRDENRQ